MEEIKLPPAERAAKTAIGAGSSGKGTVGTYLKADNLFSEKKGTKLDFGSGRGEGAKLIKADTYEPYVKSKPKFNNVNDIKTNSYNKITSLNVLNVLPPEARNEAVKNIGRILKPNGEAIVSTRGVKDVESAKNKIQIKDGYIIGKGDDARFQKGFTATELKNYVQKTLGKNFTVENVKGIGKAAVKIKKLNVPKGFGGVTRQEGTPIINIQEKLLFNPRQKFSSGGDAMDNEMLSFSELERFRKENDYYHNTDPRNPMNTEGMDLANPEVQKNIVKELNDRKKLDVISEMPISREAGERMKERRLEKALEERKALKINKGGAMPKQMEMFEDGGLKDEGGEVDEESGNEVPPGSTKEEVRDDIPARLSEGEFVFPADVVRYLGLDFLMRLRQKAKAGLQRMEEMGQMGNSDEATLPDDIPFTIEDLEMEDDPVEMQVGGVVTNPLGNPTNMPNQVTTMNTPNVYNPSMGQMYTPGGVTPYAPASFKTLLPQSNLGQVKTENRKYKKGSQVRFVPFIVGTGQPLNPAQLAQLEADGFKLDTGTISPTETKTKVETTKVKPTDTSSGDDSGTTTTLGATLAIGGDKDTDRPGLQKNSTTFEIGYNVPGRLPGIASIAALPGILGGKAPKGTTVDFKKGNITKTVSYEDFLKIKNDVTGQFAKDFVSRVNELEKLNKNQIIFDPKVGYKDTTTNQEVDYDKVVSLGKDISDRLIKDTRDRSFLGFDVSKSATDAYNELSDSEKDAYNDYTTEQQEKEEGARFTAAAEKAVQQATGKSLAQLEAESRAAVQQESDSGDGGFSGEAGSFEDAFGTGEFGGTYKGSLITRRKSKPKVKKMKRGGLASR